MVKRFAVGVLVLCLAAAVVAEVVPEPNVNMVSGTQWPGGDPFLQRQNEPSVAVSTRNPMHLLAGANDYRTVDLAFDTPPSPGEEEKGDAWLGVFKSRNGGQTWWSTLLDGYPQQTNSTSPLKGFQAGADAVVRSGPNGMFYYSGLALNREPVGNPLSAVFVARFIDNNNTENGDPIAYLSTTVIDRGNSGTFLDKPWVAVGPGTGTCTVSGQTFPAQNVYVAYTAFVGNDNNLRTKMMFARSTDCGATWSAPIKLSEGIPVNQGASIAVSPTGAVYVLWRRFATTNEPHAILISKSVDQGKTFTKAAVVRDITPFEQGMTYYSIRTNAYPATAVDDSGNLYVVWADRGFHANNDGRIVMMRSPDGVTWTQPSVVDGGANRGHQFMPTIAAAGGKVVVVYYDLRDDSTKGVFAPLGGGQYLETRMPVGDRTTPQGALQFVFTQYLLDSAGHRRHTLDLRAARGQTGLMGAFGENTRVSRYVFGSRPGQREIEQLQYNPANLPMFRLGTRPFIGDYIDMAGYASGNTRVFHAVWTDNRDVRPPLDGNWANYTAPNSASRPTTSRLTGGAVPPCVTGQTGMRNQNIYSARITDGLFAASPGNSKQLVDKLGQPIERAFVVFVQNATKQARSFRLTATQPNPGEASFNQFAFQPSIDITIPGRSSASRSVYVYSPSNPHASVIVNVEEMINGAPAANGLTSSVVINPDPLNPDVSNPDVSNPDVSNPDVSNPDVSNPDVSNAEVHNPDVSNPDVSNPDVSNPDVSNPDVSNPDVSNPDVSNPDVSNPDVSNPTVANPDVSNPDVSNSAITDTTWVTHNTGNTTSGYAVKLATMTPVPPGVQTQLIINRIYQTPIATTCALKVEKRYQVIANVINPEFTTLGQLTAADPDDATLWLAPGDAARITLRVYAARTVFNPVTAIAPAIVSQAVNTLDAGNPNATPPIALPLFITTTSLPDGVAGAPYTASVAAIGGNGARTWTVQGPQAMTIDGNGTLAGTLAAADSFVTVTVADTSGRTATRTFTLHVAQPLVVSTTTLPDATWGRPYTAAFQSTGGTAPVSWAAAGLPAGLSLNAQSGAVSGTPAGSQQMTYNIAVSATDSANPAQSFPATVSLKIGPPVTLSPATVAPGTFQDGVVGLTYPRGVPVELGIAGGYSPYTVTATGLPPGIAVDNNGFISGTPTGAGTYTPAFTVRDSGNPARSAAVTMTLPVVQPLSVTTPDILPPALIDKPYSATMTASGGRTPYTWSLLQGPLPAGLSLDPATGVISGTPTVLGRSFFRVRAVDSSRPAQTADSNTIGVSVVGSFTVNIHLKYNAQALTPTTTPEIFVKDIDANTFLDGSQITWNGADVVSVSGLVDHRYVIEVASRETASRKYLPGGFWSQTQFLGNAVSVNMAQYRLIRVTAPLDNSTIFSVFSCPPSESVQPTALTWQPIDIAGATYRYTVYKASCTGTWTQFVSGTTSGTSVPLSLPASAANEYYPIKIEAFSPAGIRVGEVMSVGSNWHGWDVRFTVP